MGAEPGGRVPLRRLERCHQGVQQVPPGRGHAEPEGEECRSTTTEKVTVVHLEATCYCDSFCVKTAASMGNMGMGWSFLGGIQGRALLLGLRNHICVLRDGWEGFFHFDHGRYIYYIPTLVPLV